MSQIQPNIILITTDQQRTDTLSCYGSDFTDTPHLDRMAERGIRFDRAYCTNPVCTPSRASIFSGKYPSRHGGWNVGMNVPTDMVTIAHRLSGAGFRTHLIGKAHMNAFGGSSDESMETKEGWEERFPKFTGPYYGFETVEFAMGHGGWGILGHYGDWVKSQVPGGNLTRYRESERLCSKPFGGEACVVETPLEHHNSVWTANRAISFLESVDKGKPFFLNIGFQDPHHPHFLPREWADTVDVSKIPLPDYEEGELADKPPHFMAAREGRTDDLPTNGEYPLAGQHTKMDYRGVSQEDSQLGRAFYYGMVRLIDREMGRILSSLDDLGLTENTLVIFTSDHGEMLGDHGFWFKGPFHYEQLVRIPLLMQWPGGFDGGREEKSVVSLVDLVPTILDACGMGRPADLDGVSLSPIWQEGKSARDHAYVEFVDDPNGLRAKTIVTETHKLTAYHHQTYGELYDLVSDPREKTNLWDNESFSKLKSELLLRLLDCTEGSERRAVRYTYA